MNKKMKFRWGVVLVVLICLTNLLGVGISYAWWRYTTLQDKANVGATKCFSIELANQANEINLTNMYPITDEEGRKLIPYTFTIKNTCSLAAKYTLNLEMLEGTTMNSKYMAVLVNKGDIKLLSSYDAATTVIDGSTEARTLDSGFLMAGASKDYSISLWMDKSVTLSDDVQNKTFKSKVVVDAVAADMGITDYIISQLDTTGKCPSISESGTVNVSTKEETSGYLCSAQDNYGTSYYYRGNVVNNYVYYAGFYWRIVRVNGNKTIRLIYDGTSAHTNGDASTDRQLGQIPYNDTWRKDNVAITDNYNTFDNAGVGYMYGNADSVVESVDYYTSTNLTKTSTYYLSKEYTYDTTNSKFTLKNPVAVLGSDITSDYIGYYTVGRTDAAATEDYLYKITSLTDKNTYFLAKARYIRYGTSSKETAQTNTNDSDIKAYIDAWYEKNIKGTENEQYLADNIYCNDRYLDSTDIKVGAGMNFTGYNWYNYHSSSSTLMCLHQNDAFTVRDTTKGNGALTYPIGLISTDEVLMAGGAGTNSNYYLYTGTEYWGGTPYNFNGLNAIMLSINSTGGVGYPKAVYEDGGVKPVINLKTNALKLGTGMIDDPYRIS